MNTRNPLLGLIGLAVFTSGGFLQAGPVRPTSNTCEAVAHWNGLSGDPPWTLVCIDPCTQGCEHTDPVQIGVGTYAETCVCYGSSVDPNGMCCRLFMTYTDGELVGPAAIGDCGTTGCESGEYCGLYWIDQETTGAKCYWY